MNYKTLEQLLHTTEPSEKLYLEYPLFSDPFPIENYITTVYMMDGGASSLFKHTPHPELKLTRTGRFRPVLPHIHPWIELGYMFSGSCEHMIRDRVYTLKRGQIYILDSDTPHSIGFLGENDIHISIVINKPFFTEVFFHHFSEESVLSRFLSNALSAMASHDNYLFFPSEDNRRIPFIMNELMIEHLSPSGNAPSIVSSLISLLFLELVNVYEQQSSLDTESPLIPILRYIKANYLTCSLISTARAFSLNPNYLTTMLKKKTGMTFKELVQQQRFLSITGQLQNTGLSIEEIAHLNGYENTTYFYKKFREEYHCSPKEFRERYRRTGPSSPDGS